MRLREVTPCDADGICPYNAEYFRDCITWCGINDYIDEAYDKDEYDDDDLEMGFDPYLGCYTDDC